VHSSYLDAIHSGLPIFPPCPVAPPALRWCHVSAQLTEHLGSSAAAGASPAAAADLVQTLGVAAVASPPLYALETTSRYWGRHDRAGVTIAPSRRHDCAGVTTRCGGQQAADSSR